MACQNFDMRTARVKLELTDFRHLAQQRKFHAEDTMGLLRLPKAASTLKISQFRALINLLCFGAFTQICPMIAQVLINHIGQKKLHYKDYMMPHVALLDLQCTYLYILTFIHYVYASS